MANIPRSEWRRLLSDTSLSYSQIALMTDRKIATVLDRAYKLKLSSPRSSIPRRTLSDAQQAELVQNRLDGWTMNELAFHYEIGRTSVWRLLKRYGVQNRIHVRSWYESKSLEVRMLRDLGWSWGKIGQKLGAHPDALREAMRSIWSRSGSAKT